MKFEFPGGAPPVCDICKGQPSSIQFVEQKGSSTRKLSLCQSCAAAQGIAQAGGSVTLNIPSLIAAFAAAETAAGSRVICPECGLSEGDFRATGRVGCPRCYIEFRELIETVVTRAHFGTIHRGLAPARLGGSARGAEVAELRDKLAEAVRAENYEEAARLRDRIRSLENTPS